MSLTSRAETRAAQLTSSGLGIHFSSPRKPRDKRKTQVIVELPGQKAKQRKLLAKMANLMDTSSVQEEKHPETVTLEPDTESADAWEDVFQDNDALPVTESTDNCPPCSQPTPSRRTQPDLTSTRLYDSWKSLIPTLVTVLLEYTARTLGAPLQRTPLGLSLCRSHTCAQKRSSIVCLFFDRKYSCIQRV